MSSKEYNPVDTFPFGRVVAPIQLNEDGTLETFIEYDNKDLANLLSNLSWRFLMFRKTKRQKEIQSLAEKLSELIKNERKLKGRIWAPIPIRQAIS